MAHSYTPGLTVSERTLVRKRRQLPIAGAVLVQQGEQVQAQTIVARAELPGKVHVVNVANVLGVAPDEIPEYLTRKDGEGVEKGDVIAENKPFIKWLKTEVTSPIKGFIHSASTITGQLLLREPPRLLELPAYVEGRVVEVVQGQGVTVETECMLVQGIFGVGGEAWGELDVAADGPDQMLEPEHLKPDMKGKIILAGSFLSAKALKRAGELGIVGLVVGGIHDKDLRELLGYDLGVAITGTERVGFTLVLTEGFGTIPMAGKTFALLSQFRGQQASISGATQIRAGVIRPEILISHPKDRDLEKMGEIAPPGSEQTGIQVGDLARIIRDPLFGQIGKVVGLPTDLQEIPTESSVRVLEVSLPDGTVATIPRANVEIIEER